MAISSPNGDLNAVSNWKWQAYKDESPWGIHNLAGGAAEWTSSNYTDKTNDPNYGSRTIKGNAFGQQPAGFERHGRVPLDAEALAHHRGRAGERPLDVAEIETPARGDIARGMDRGRVGRER